jgi:ElaB/YqjD/DUF883 family membrane-anchored ribosome-binding protein
MDDETFIASYVAQEMQRISERMKNMVESEAPPSEEERDAVMKDMEETLSRVTRALEQIDPSLLTFAEEEEEKIPS